jgi:hypothetical protein
MTIPKVCHAFRKHGYLKPVQNKGVDELVEFNLDVASGFTAGDSFSNLQNSNFLKFCVFLLTGYA